MAFGIPGITAPPQPTPASPIGTLDSVTPAGSDAAGLSPKSARNDRPEMAPDRVQRSDSATNANAYHDAIVRAYGGSGIAAVSAPDHAAKSDAAIAHGAASSSWAGDFATGVGEGAWGGASGMVQGLGDLAKGSYKLTTSIDARSHAIDTISKGAAAAGQFAKTAVTDPAQAAGQVGRAASGTWSSVSTAYEQAVADGNGAEFIGKAVGQGAVFAATLPVPGGAESEGVAALGDAGRIGEVAGELGKAGDAAAAGKALHTTDALSSNAVAAAARGATTASFAIDGRAIRTAGQVTKGVANRAAETPRIEAANRARHEAYVDRLRADMQKPVVSDPVLQKRIDALYRPGATVGSGSTAAAVRRELQTGMPVGGRLHSQKAENSIVGLQKWLDKHPTAKPADKAAAENVIRDLKNALRGN